MTRMSQWKVSPDQSGIKLIAFLKSKLPKEVSSREVKRAIEAGDCQLNGKIERFASRLVGTGDCITFMQSIKTPKNTFSIEDHILYIDDCLLAYNKPPGINSEDPYLLKKLSEMYSSLTLLHRLDKQTTGVLLFARSENISKLMLDLFKQRQISKTYLALVDGVPKETDGIIENYLGKLNVYEGQTLWGAVAPEKGMLARTTWHLKKSGEEASLIECHPETGRTHQIRVHLSGLGHPILGDHQYGRSFHCQHRPQRLMLHAAEIVFKHPATGKLVAITSPIPQDFADACDAVTGQMERKQKNKDKIR